MSSRIVLGALLTAAALTACEKHETAGPASAQTSRQKAEALLQKMTLEEKIGQMTQVDSDAIKGNEADLSKYFIGSVLSGGNSNPPDNSARMWRDFVDRIDSEGAKTRLAIPIIYGIDAVHGHNNIKSATIFPHNIGLGATRDEKIVEAAARVTAEEIAGTDIDWTFAPCVAVVRNDRWGRTYESFGEDPALVAKLGAAAVRGLQTTDLSGPSAILSCTKHFLADGGTMDGKDQGNSEMDLDTLKKIHLPGYEAAIKENTGSIMVSYSAWNGKKMHGNGDLINGLLKGEMGFQGFVVSDWAAIDQLSPDYKADIEQAINAGLDMIMIPFGAETNGTDPNSGEKKNTYQDFITYLTQLVQEGKVPQSRIDDAVLRILTAKYDLGLFEKRKGGPELFDAIGSPAHREVARDAVRKSLVLLQNRNNVLPLSKSVKSIGLLGPGADSINMQCGGWTVDWQGMGNDTLEGGTTILKAIKAAVPNATIIQPPDSINEADVMVVVAGEQPYAEFQGDRTDLGLDEPSLQAIKAAKETGKPVVLVLLSGRPLIIEPVLPLVDAVVAAWLPGSEGAGVADVLFGDYKPTGKLPVSWPRTMAQVPINFGDKNYDPLFPFNFGLSW